MKALLLPQTSELGPSSRYRVYQLLPHFHFETEVSPGLDTPTYEAIYLHNRGSKLTALRKVWQRRRQDLARARGFDVVFVQKGFFPGLYAGLEVRLPRPYVFDLDDAIWLPRQGGSRLMRALHRERAVQTLLRRAAAVTAGNELLAEYARRFNPNVTLVPSTVDVARYPQATGNAVGWIGSRTTLPYLKPLAPVFRELGILPRVIAAGTPDFPAEFRPWRLETELGELAQLGIGVAPLPDTPWERGKCGVKILQYMACGLPVVASPVGVQCQLVRNGETGFLASTPEEWRERLGQLLSDAGLRHRLGAAGRALVTERYDVSIAAERVAKVLEASAQT